MTSLYESDNIARDNAERADQLGDAELRAVLDHLPASLMVRRRDGTIVKASNVAAEIFGAPLEQVEGSDYRDFCDEKSASDIERLDEVAWDSSESVIVDDVVHRGPTGIKRTLTTSRVPLRRSDDPRDDLMCSMAVDVTAEREAADELATSQRRFELATRAAGLGVWEYTPATHHIYVSDLFAQMLGLSSGDMSGDTDQVLDLVHPDDNELARTNLLRLTTVGGTGAGEYRMRHPSGEYRSIATTTDAIAGPDGVVTNIIGTARDVTVAREREAELRRLNDQLTLASELAAVGFWRIDVATSSIYWSDQVFAIHGRRLDQGMPTLEEGINAYHADDIEMVQQVVDAAMKSGQPFAFEARVMRHTEVRHVRASCGVELDEHGVATSVHGVFSDITEDRERAIELETLLAELERSNEELSRFSYVCSHDMKEPVRMIEQMSTLLLDPAIAADEGRRTEMLRRISRNMSRLRTIIDGLLAYSRLDARVEVTSVDLNGVVNEIVDSLQLALAESKTSVTLLPLPTVAGARVHFIQLLQNLITNAMKYAETTRPRVQISSWQSDDDHHVIVVEDNGPGISADDRESVFEMFGRLDAAEDIEGTGLGLSICRRIVTQYNGTITCTQSWLGGAAFEIRLPVLYEAAR